MIEIERKFLVDRLPDDRSEPVRIQQAYIALDGAVEVRVRRRNDTYRLTVKGGLGLERSEIELPLDDGDGEALWHLAHGRTTEKRRSTVDLGEHIAEIDQFEGRLDGVCIVEVEFDDRAAADAFDPPEWFGREVTGVRAWSNSHLATNGCPPV